MWDVESLDEMMYRILKAKLQNKIRIDLPFVWRWMRAKIFNMQREQVFAVAQRHYDIGNDLYGVMLGKRMVYSCGYWKVAKDLDDAEEAKLDLICRKIYIDKGQTVLDIGSGWGSFLQFAAQRYGARGIGVTVSKEQVEYANSAKGDLPIVTRLLDYLDVDGRYDRIVSLGMFEHVGYKNYRLFMKKVHSLMRDDGIFLLHTIGGNVSVSQGEAWFQKYIFPHGMIPSIAQIGAASESLFSMEDWHNFGPDYDKTLMAWFANFDAHWPQLQGAYGDRFYRMWKFYLLTCAAAFRAREMQLWQIVFTKVGGRDRYVPVR
jgi:cyclopropane-fatty-acyl-phospholipid synthase